MSNIKITFYYRDVWVWPLNGGGAPSKLFNNLHTSLQSLLHSKTLVHSQNVRPQQPVSLYRTHMNSRHYRFIVQWPVGVCGVQQSNKTFSGGKCRVRFHTNSFVDAGRFRMFSGSRRCCDSLSTTFQPATILSAKKQDIHNNSTPFSAIRHSNNNSNTISSTFFFKGTILHRFSLYFTLSLFHPRTLNPSWSLPLLSSYWFRWGI